ncbi:hypothetical protein [Pleurocapsa sp. FMAR1]|uniref:hypothetical protein n=1 Tax=Pleurocapsa sp. FMAR1 TaxID=3040204 RepID=UPI0029C8746F|nr:hypothetical protein [Pleurocapsa sp. FMAR1]
MNIYLVLARSLRDKDNKTRISPYSFNSLLPNLVATKDRVLAIHLLAIYLHK